VPSDDSSVRATAAFDRLHRAGSRAVLDGAVSIQTPPVDGGARWGMSVILRPDRRAAEVLATLTREALRFAGGANWPTGSAESSHFTVRALEDHRSRIPPDDAEVAQYIRALRAAAEVTQPLEMRLSGLTLTPSSVLACAEDDSGRMQEFAERLRAELGAEGHYEDEFNRDIWYASLVHFLSRPACPAELVEWVGRRRRVDLGVSTARGAQLILWRYTGSGMVPDVLAEAPLAAR
jgi:hypothetical protein